MTEAEIKDALLLAYEYCYRHDEWVESAESTLMGLSATDALRRPAATSKCIWEIVLHVAVWNENIVERTKTGEKTRPAEGAWPKLPGTTDDQAWETAKTRLTRSLASIEKMMRDASLDELNGGPYGLADLLCRFFHVAYHLGQIVKLREFRGAAG